nr:hypothetical protein [Tanacetum cinerariifolium]
MYEPDPEDQLWTLTQNFMHAPVEWKLYDLSGVHHLTAKEKEIFMLVEKEYPLRRGLALVMISYKLQVENYSQMADDLIRKIYNIANTPRQQYTRRARIAQSSALPTIADEPASPVRDAQEEEIVRLKERVQVLEDRECNTAKQSGDDAPIKGRSINEGEAAAKRISNDSEEIARVLTSMDAKLMFPLAVVPFPLLVPLLLSFPLAVKPMTKKQKREYYMVVIKSNLGWRFKDFKGMTFKEIEAKFAEVSKQIEDFIPMGSKEETKRIKRKGLNLEKEQVKKQKSAEEAPKMETSTEEFTKEKIKEMMQEMMHICPRLPGQTFDDFPFKEEILAFLRFLGHSGEIKKLTHILWGMYHKKNVDFAYLLWEDFVYQVEHKDAKKSNEMYYPRFRKVIIYYFTTKDPSIPRRNKVNWHYVRDDQMFTTI